MFVKLCLIVDKKAQNYETYCTIHGRLLSIEEMISFDP